MTESLFAQTVATATGLLMLTAVLQVWRRSTDASTRLLAVQGAALALLVGAIGLAEGHAELVAVAVVVFALKGVLLPWVLARTIARSGIHREDSSAVNPVSGLLAAAGWHRIPVPGTGAGGAGREAERVVGLGPAFSSRGQRGIEGAGIERCRSAIRGGGQ